MFIKSNGISRVFVRKFNIDNKLDKIISYQSLNKDSKIANTAEQIAIEDCCDVQSEANRASTDARCSLASYRTRRQQLAEEVPGLYIRRLTLEDPKIARERPDSALQLPARHVCHPRASYVPSERPTSSYRSWLEQLRRERQAVLTITSLQLPDCPIPLIDSLANNRCRAASSRNADADETLNELFAKVAVARASAQGPRNSASSARVADQTHQSNAQQHCGVEPCCEPIANVQDGPAETAALASEDDNEEDEDASEAAKPATQRAAGDECTCSDVSEKLRINIRKKTEVRRSPRSLSPEVTHTIRIAMKCPGQRERPARRSNAKRHLELDPEQAESASALCCPPLSLALDFTLDCNSLQLTSRELSLRPIAAGDLDRQD